MQPGPASIAAALFGLLGGGLLGLSYPRRQLPAANATALEVVFVTGSGAGLRVGGVLLLVGFVFGVFVTRLAGRPVALRSPAAGAIEQRPAPAVSAPATQRLERAAALPGKRRALAIRVR